MEDARDTPKVRRGGGPLRRLYEWVLSWADRPSGPAALFTLSFTESFFFPIPPDPLLMALALGRPSRALWFAAITTVASVLGGLGGYLIGLLLFEQVGRPVIEFYGAMEKFEHVGTLYRENLILALGTAGLTPIPYKVFTIAAGAFAIPVLPFVLISAASRGLRFFAVAALIYRFGQPVKTFIDRYFNLLTIVFVILLVGGFYALRIASR
ncbi:MAG TPA: YqaA family protein [Gemmatimonadaceae bacterium]|nr:YqaA family protein [Gemmatimonadaceae bacterium]